MTWEIDADESSLSFAVRRLGMTTFRGSFDRFEVAIRQDALGATAVVGVRFDAAEVGREMVEIVAYGTAVVLEGS